MEKKDEARAFLASLMVELIEKPDALKIEATVDERGLNLQVKADPSDMRLLIGAKGTVAESFRRIMYLYGKKHGAKINVVVY